MTGNPRISGHRVPSRLAVCGRCGHCPQSTMSTASFYDLQSDAIQVVLHVLIQNVHLLFSLVLHVAIHMQQLVLHLLHDPLHRGPHF